MTAPPVLIDVQQPVYDPVSGTHMSHLAWARVIAREVRRKYGFVSGSPEEKDLEQTAAMVVIARAPKYDADFLPPGGDPDMLFRGWVKLWVHGECQREAIRLKNGGTFNTTRTPNAAPCAADEAPADVDTDDERRRRQATARPPDGVAVPLGDDPDVTYRIHAAGLTVEGEPDIDAWAGAVGRLAKQQNGALWAIGDLVVYGQERFGRELVNAQLDANGYAAETARKAAHIARVFPVGIRIPELPWSHHRIVAPLKRHHARRLLLRAVRENLSTSDLKRVVVAMRPKPEGLRLPVTALERRIVRLTPVERERLNAAAVKHGFTLDAFLQVLAVMRGVT